MNLKTLTAELGKIRDQQAAIAARLSDVAAERFDIESATTDRATSIAAAEQALVDALAAHELGEPADVDGAQQRLDGARLLAQNGIESATRLRVLDALKARHEGEHQACHERGLVILASTKQSEIDALRIQAIELRGDAETAMETVARSECLLNAIRSEINERGASYDLPALNEQAVVYRVRLTPNQARAEVLGALAA